MSMGRELAGVIACVQEIELACITLEEHDNEEFLRAIRDIKARAQAVLADPVPEGAKAFLEFLRKGKGKIQEHRLIAGIFGTMVMVDGIKTNLSNLCDELEELMADLGLWGVSQN
jgi:hypothetical protein